MALVRSRASPRRLLALLPADGTTHYRRAGEPIPSPAGAAFDHESTERLTEAAATSPTGSVLFDSPARAVLALPMFGVERRLDPLGIDPAPLVELIERPRTIGVFLLRRGGFACGVLHAGDVIAAKAGQRFVKNRHRKGGQSSSRYVRTREKQLHELFEKACRALGETLAAHADALDCVFVGGDRLTLRAFRKECEYLDRFGDRLMPRLLHLPGDPRRASLDAVPRELSMLDVLEIAAVDT